MASSKSCCPDGSWPALAVSTDDSRADAMLGVVETLGDDLTVYTVPPPAPSTMGILVVYDVHGFAGARVKSVCDVSCSRCPLGVFYRENWSNSSPRGVLCVVSLSSDR